MVTQKSPRKGRSFEIDKPYQLLFKNVQLLRFKINSSLNVYSICIKIGQKLDFSQTNN